MRPAAILFDFDGVIADSEIVSAAMFAQVLSAAGLPTSIDEAMDLYTGLNRDDTLRKIADHWGTRAPADIAETLAAHSTVALAQGIAPVAGAVDFVMDIAPLPIAIGSSSASAYLRDHLALFGLADRFGPHVYSGREHVTRGKPHPDIYLHAAAQLGVAPADCLIVEDSPVGATAAVAAGATVVGLCAGGHCRADHGERLLSVGVHHIARDYADLRGLLGLG